METILQQILNEIKGVGDVNILNTLVLDISYLVEVSTFAVHLAIAFMVYHATKDIFKN